MYEPKVTLKKIIIIECVRHRSSSNSNSNSVTELCTSLAIYFKMSIKLKKTFHYGVFRSNLCFMLVIQFNVCIKWMPWTRKGNNEYRVVEECGGTKGKPCLQLCVCSSLCVCICGSQYVVCLSSYSFLYCMTRRAVHSCAARAKIQSNQTTNDKIRQNKAKTKQMREKIKLSPCVCAKNQTVFWFWVQKHLDGKFICFCYRNYIFFPVYFRFDFRTPFWLCAFIIETGDEPMRSMYIDTFPLIFD